MGWTFTDHATRQDIIDKILRDWTRLHYAVVAHRSTGNQLWIVIEHTPDAQPLERFIACHLLAKERGYGWGSKDMTEHMGPCEHSCPLALLAMAQPAPTEPSSVEWRARVQTYHETTKRRRAFFKSLHVGQLVSLQPGCQPPQVTILALSPLVGQWEERRYRVKPGHLAVPAEFPHSSIPLERPAS